MIIPFYYYLKAGQAGGGLLGGEEGGVLQQVDEEVGRAVEHGEQVGEVGHITNPVGPHQLTLYTKGAQFSPKSGLKTKGDWFCNILTTQRLSNSFYST